jgi:predicted nucleotidyltransferase
VTSTSSSRLGVPRDQVAAALALLDGVAAPLMGVYLYGSAVDGGLKPDSDLDLFGVIERRLTGDERRAIIEGLQPLSGRSARPLEWRPIELTLVVRDEVVPWRYPPRFDLQYGEWLRPAFLAGDLKPWPSVNPDVAVLITIVLGRSEALVGPPARELLKPVPREHVLQAMTDELEPLLGDLETDTRNVLLTLARMWMTASTGEVRPKDAAAAWAADRLPVEHRPLVLRARSGYLGEVVDRWDDLGAARLVADDLVRGLRMEHPDDRSKC